MSRERRQNERGRRAVTSLLEERRRMGVAWTETERQVDYLREDLRRFRSDNGKVTQETQGVISHFESSLAKEKYTTVQRNELASVREKSRAAEDDADRRVFQLQQELDAARQEMAGAKGEVVEMMKSMLDRQICA